ncbi:hypothetical protein CEP52_000302 [Fusarium oligoseptatum]|uniref:Uncharacterized protein n=1 Tax=Fusarium oligoseptatum TaxID=2604345 RepID=A0A428UQJ5_9HYPO|nr:hypothetical protein CEP52_000302 [Fusarium oligoseptatum]
MSEANRDVSQYKYSAMSNLVLQADRRFVTRRTDEATGDPESLAGRLSIRDMGARVARDDAPKPKKQPGLPDIERGSLREGEDILAREQRRRKAEAHQSAGVLGANDLLVEGITYRPRTPATRATFDLIITIVANNLGDVPHEVVRSAADAVLEYLKDDDLKDLDKKKEIDDILGVTLNPKQFNELVNLGKKITDYDAQDDDEDVAMGGADGDDAEIDERQGVAVAFDEDEDDEEGGIVHEVRDESSDDEEEEEEKDDNADAKDEDAVVDVGDEMILDSAPSGGKQAEKEKHSVPARDIDAFWLQRQIGILYPDAHEQTDKTKEALRILSGEPDEADGEEKSLREIEKRSHGVVRL